MKSVRVAAVQMEHSPSDKTANLGKIRALVEQAAQQNVEIIAFPECCITGYWHLRHLTRPRARRVGRARLRRPVSTGTSHSGPTAPHDDRRRAH